MKYLQAITTVTLSAFLCGSLSVPVLAASTLSATSTPSEKEEVIYIMTDASGKVEDMEAVNIFSGGDITDYGDYSVVKVMNADESISQEGDKITFSSDVDKVYYQGTMKSSVIPWKISIRYFLDGKEYSAQDLAGKSGSLEIHFSVSKNEDCQGSFYEDYALQASFTLDTDLCSNIISDGATLANVGSDKQLTYTILPGKGIDTVIKADVTDFTMEAAAINGVRLNMDLEVDDAQLMEKVDDLVSAIGSIDDGASKLHEGTGSLYEATQTLNSKVSQLNSGVGSLTSGAADLYSGLSAITGQNDSLTSGAYTAYEGLCTAASAAINSQLAAYGMDVISLTPSNYAGVLQSLQEGLENAAYQQMMAAGAAQQMSGSEGETSQEDTAEGQDGAGKQDSAGAQGSAEVQGSAEAQGSAGVQGSAEVQSSAAAQISAVVQQISQLKSQLDSYGAFYQGVLDYSAAVSEAAEGAGTLKSNMDILSGSTGSLQSAVSELNDAVGELYGGTGELTDGTSEFVDETSDMDTQISDEIDSMTSSITGGDAETVSFVSDKNTNVDSVQFVIKTAAIEEEESEAEEEVEEEQLSFWQKLLRLFGRE